MTLAQSLHHSPLVPWWLAISAGAVMLLVLARYLLALGGAEMDARRKRIRTANTILMMLVTPLVAYGFGVATPSRARAYVFVWVLICSILFMVIMLALLDMLHSVRLHRAQMRAMRRSMTAQALLEAQGTGPPPQSPPPA
ncbi:MAG: hypothetical protein WD749_03475 [Phycisphaerales bacterium]